MLFALYLTITFFLQIREILGNPDILRSKKVFPDNSDQTIIPLKPT
jgi:hypothetical protein